MTDFESRFTQSLRTYVDRQELLASPTAVVAEVTGRARQRHWNKRRLVPVGAFAVAVVAVVAAAIVGPRLSDQGSYPAMVRVGGLDYHVGVAHALVVADDELIPYGELTFGRFSMPLSRFADRIAYRLPGVDPLEALVARAAPGAFGDPPSEFVLLYGGALFGPDSLSWSAALCGYFDLDHPAMRESECLSRSSPQPTSAPTPRPSPSPSSPMMPSFTPRADVDLGGRLAWNRMGEGCVQVVTDDGSSVELGELPEGYRAVDDYPTAIVGPDGQLFARFDDRIGLRGRIVDSAGNCGSPMFAATEIVYLAPQPSPATVDTIAGPFSGSGQLEGGCAWVSDESTGTWEVMWPDGYRVGFEGDAPLLISPAGEVVARHGDRIGLRGTEGWYAEGQLIVRFKVAAIDPFAAERGSDIPREAVRREWAATHGLEELSGTLSGFFAFRITDGTADQAKLEELERLNEVRTVTRNPLGSHCMVGAPFTATEISFIDRAPVSTEAILPEVTTLPDRSLTADGHDVELTGLRSLLLDGQEGWLPLDGDTVALATDPINGRASVWLADLDDGVARMIHPAGVLEDVDPDRERLLVRTRSGFDLIARDGSLIATLAIPDAADAVLLADGTIAVTRPKDIGVWDPVVDSLSWTPLPAGLEGASLIAVASNVVAWEWHGGNVLLDPRTATEIGERWQAGSYAVAASPNGRHFIAHVYQSTGHVGRLELRDGLTGEILAVDEGIEMTSIDSIAWLSDEVVLVMRKPSPTYEVSVPPAEAELHTVDDFATRIAIPSLTPNQSGVVQRGPYMSVFGLSGEIVLMTAGDAPPG